MHVYIMYAAEITRKVTLTHSIDGRPNGDNASFGDNDDDVDDDDGGIYDGEFMGNRNVVDGDGASSTPYPHRGARDTIIRT